jgi:hypothetical protein
MLCSQLRIYCMKGRAWQHALLNAMICAAQLWYDRVGVPPKHQ